MHKCRSMLSRGIESAVSEMRRLMDAGNEGIPVMVISNEVKNMVSFSHLVDFISMSCPTVASTMSRDPSLIAFGCQML